MKWHNSGCVWDNVASEWAGGEEWSKKGRKCQIVEDKRYFDTFAKQSVKHSTVHRTRIGDKKKSERKMSRTKNSGLLLIRPFTLAKKDGSIVLGYHCHYAMGQKYSGKMGHIQKTLHSWWKKKVAFPPLKATVM